jgi:hypothetical protein
VAFGLQVSDDGLDGGAAAQLALDDTGDAVLLAGDEDTTGILCVVAAVSLVDIGPLDRTAGEWLGRNISFDPVVLCFFDRIVVSLRRGPPCAVRWRMKT